MGGGLMVFHPFEGDIAYGRPPVQCLGGGCSKPFFLLVFSSGVTLPDERVPSPGSSRSAPGVESEMSSCKTHFPAPGCLLPFFLASSAAERIFLPEGTRTIAPGAAFPGGPPVAGRAVAGSGVLHGDVQAFYRGDDRA